MINSSFISVLKCSLYGNECDMGVKWVAVYLAIDKLRVKLDGRCLVSVYMKLLLKVVSLSSAIPVTTWSSS